MSWVRQKDRTGRDLVLQISFASLNLCMFLFVDGPYMRCIYPCCGAPPSAPLIVLHLLIGHSGHALTLWRAAPLLLSLPNPSLTPWLLLRLSHFWWGGLKTQPIRARLTEGNTDVTVSLIERKEEGRTAVSCVTMGLCLITLGWINGIYLIDGSITTTTQADQLRCNWSRLSQTHRVK